MGNNRILDARKHLVDLILKINRVEDAEHAYNLAHAIEHLIQCEHTEIAINAFHTKGVKTDDDDFPTTFDFD